jgi:hypothetical protein
VLTLETVKVAPPSSEIEVFFSVKTVGGDPVTDLDATDFSILENGERNSFFESTLEILPTARVFRTFTVLMLDLSGSIRLSGSLPDVRRAAIQFVDTIFGTGEPAVHRVAVYWFDGGANIINALPGAQFSSDRDQIVSAIEDLDGSFDISTNLHGAIVQGVGLLNQGTRSVTRDISRRVRSCSSLTARTTRPEYRGRRRCARCVRRAIARSRSAFAASSTKASFARSDSAVSSCPRAPGKRPPPSL